MLLTLHILSALCKVATESTQIVKRRLNGPYTQSPSVLSSEPCNPGYGMATLAPDPHPRTQAPLLNLSNK